MNEFQIVFVRQHQRQQSAVAHVLDDLNGSARVRGPYDEVVAGLGLELRDGLGTAVDSVHGQASSKSGDDPKPNGHRRSSIAMLARL